MARTLILLLIAGLAAAPATAAVTFDWAYVGNSGNAADPETGYGAVAYDYAIANHEVTNAQYVEFLNATDPTGANARALYNANMARNFGGIANTGPTDGARYVVTAARAQHPVIHVSFLDAMRFTNWLHNGQGAGDTETGAYTIGSGLDEGRQANAKYWIPSEDEWYKAAYHDASAGMAGVYFDYATGSDSVPISDLPEDNPAAVNYFNDDGVANGFNDGGALNRPTSRTSPIFDVGSFMGAASPYGTFDQNGNVSEWIEEVRRSSFRGVRGGSWSDSSCSLRAYNNWTDTPVTRDNINLGFRIATVPEPSTLLMATLLSAGLLSPRRA